MLYSLINKLLNLITLEYLSVFFLRSLLLLLTWKFLILIFPPLYFIYFPSFLSFSPYPFFLFFFLPTFLPACLPACFPSFLLLSLISLFIGRYSFCWEGGWESCFKLFFGWNCESSRSTKVCATDILKE